MKNKPTQAHTEKPLYSGNYLHDSSISPFEAVACVSLAIWEALIGKIKRKR